MYQNQNKGISAGILAGVFWGTPFLVPLVLASFSSIDITFGRFLVFGLISCFALPKIIKLFRDFSLSDLFMLLALSATGFWLYTIVLFIGVKLTNGVIAAQIVGTLPLTITLFSNPRFNYRLWLGLFSILLGMTTLLIVPLFNADIFHVTFQHIHPMGILVLLLALGMWTWFAIANARFIVKHPYVRALDYSSLMGILSLLCMLPIMAISHDFHALFINPNLNVFIFWCVVLGLGASWIANVFWAYCCKNTPSSVYGTLIVSETIFGLIYSFIFQHRLPYFYELISIALLITGVVMTVHSQTNE